MAFVATLTGTNQSVNATNGSPNVTVASTAGWVVGATIQGTGWAAGTKIVSFVANTSAVFSNNFTGTTGATNVIVSSVYGSNLTITLTASGDVGTWQNVFNAGFGSLQGSRSLLHPGALTITFGSIVSGARFDHQDWTVEFGTGGRMLFDSGLLAGEQRGGYMIAGSLLIKADGPTFVFNNWNNGAAGGSSMFLNTGGLLTQGGTFRMHDARFVVRTGNNMCPAFTSVRDLMIVENLILDYEGDAGPNASIGCGFGTILNPKIIKANSGITRTNANSIGTITGLYYLGLFGDSPNAKFAIPNNFIMDGYAPQVTNAQLIGGFQSNTTETYSNIDLSSPGWGLSDLPTKYQRFGGPNEIRFPRTVSFELNDGNAANLTDVTLYIRSGTTTVLNAVQAGDYSALTPALVLNWTGSGSYRFADTNTNTISQVAQFRKNGYISQTVSYSLNNAAYSQPIFMLTDPAYGSVTPAQAATLTGLSLDYTNKVYTVSAARNLDQIYAFGQYSQALTANSAQADFQTSVGGKYALTSPWKMAVTAGALTMGTYNNTFNSSTAWTFGSTASLNLDKDDVVWTPGARADLFQFQNGSTFNITNGSTLTVSPTAGLGYGSATTSEFRSGSTLNMSNSTVTYNILASQSGTVFSNTEAGATWNISNSTLTLNCPNGAQVAIHAYFVPASNISNFTVNGTATNVIWQMGFTSNNSKMVGFTYGGAIFGNGTSNILMDTYTYTGSLTTIPNTFGSANKWWWVDPVMTAGGLFRWAAGSTPTGSSGFYGVIGFRPTFTIDKAGFAPRVRFTPSAMASRYPSFQVQATELSTIALSNFFRDPTFMPTTDGFLPFLDSLDDKTALNTINWTVETRQAGWIDQTVTFTAATAKKGLITSTFSGAVDSNYVNASTAVADAALITVNTVTKTIAPVSGSLSWSPQRLYNALKVWWATYASNTDFLSATSGSTLNLGDYNTDANLRFTTGNSTDLLTTVRTTGLINAATNDISVTDSRGTSTIWQFQGVQVGSSIVVYDSSNVTKLFQGSVTTAGTYTLYITSGTTGTYFWAVEKYGKQRESGSFAANTGGLLFYTPLYVEDVGISQTNQSTVAAYTAIETASKFYDRTALFRLTEQGIKLGQIATRSGTAIEIGSFSHVINKDAASVYAIVGSTITTKSTSYAGDAKYTTEIATPPATITANSTEVITIAIEDANGNSQLTINGGDGTFQLWKVTTSTPTADYATGTLLATVGNVTYRFIGVAGFDIIGVDINSNIRRRTSMAKGVYTQSFYVGEQIQLAQAPEVTEILTKVEIMQIDVDAIQAKTDNLTFTVPNVLDANIQYVNDVQVKGTGEEGNEWGPV
jgi:hypothetical protein